MAFRRALLLVALLLGLGIASAGPASAELYTVTVSGGGCPGGALVSVSSGERVIGSVVADGGGRFEGNFSVPEEEAPQRQRVRVSCGPVAFDVGIDLTRPTEPFADNERSSGVAAAALIGGAAMFVAALVTVVRRRRTIEEFEASVGS